MIRFTTHLACINIVSLVVWAENASSIFGSIGAVLGALSGFMLVCIYWHRFIESDPVKWALKFLAKLKKPNAEQ